MAKEKQRFRLKDTAKLFGITIIACCAVFVCTLFLSYNIDLAAIKDVITTEAGMAMYNAQVLMGKVIAAVSGGCLIATSVVMLWFTKQSEGFVEETFNGSLPQFLVAFTRRKKLSKQEIAEIQKIIDQNAEE